MMLTNIHTHKVFYSGLLAEHMAILLSPASPVLRSQRDSANTQARLPPGSLALITLFLTVASQPPSF